MTSQLICFHGHTLEAGTELPTNRHFMCPLCGSIAEFKPSTAAEKSEAFAVTVVPVSMVEPLPDESAEPSELDDSSLETSDYTPEPAPVTDAQSRRTGSDVPSSSGASNDDVDLDGGTMVGSDVSKDVDSPSAAVRTQPMDSKPSLKPPRLSGYEIMEELGRGGMGVVYQAYDEKHGRDVALKTLQRMSPDDVVRFKQEFRALSDIAHPNIASLYELLSDGKTWCFTMEILTGVEFLDYVWSAADSLKRNASQTTLAEVSGDAPRLSLRRMNRLYDSLKQLALGLHELHRAGKLHSDIKPSNVLVTPEGRLVLLDFGLIAEITKDEDGRMPRAIQGTPQYMSPEQAACAPLSAASDWYAVGVMLYEVLTGRLPIRDKAVRIMLRKQYETPVAPIKRQPSVPLALSELCMALLEVDPAKRPSTADVLRAVDAEDLARSIEESEVATVIQSVDLVGREEHFKVLTQAFVDVSEGDTRSVFIHGRSGMGKSVLIRTFIDRIKEQDEAIVLEGRCYEQESVPFKALDSLIDAFVVYLKTLPSSRIAELMPDDILPLTRLFPVFGRFQGDDDTGRPTIESADQQELRQRAMTSLRVLLANLSESAPVVMYIDDMQWGDEDSAHLLADLVRPPHSPRLLFLGSYRREDVDRSPALHALSEAYQRGTDHPHRQELPVDPLTEGEAARLAMSLLDQDARQAQVADRIARESGGSPFFVWELAQHVQEDSSASVGTLELDEVIWSRVCRLPEETRRLLEVFAVAGRPMRASEAYETIDARTLGPGLLAQLRTSNFIRTTDRDADTIVETYHDRIRESVANHLPVSRVRGHYLKIALVIEQSGDVNLSAVQAHIASTPEFEEPGDSLTLDASHWQRVFDLAYFFDAADKPDRALPYALVAAERAWSQNALEVAEQQFEIARRGADSTSDANRFRIAEGLGDVLIMRGRYERGLQHFKTARGLASNNMVLARIDSKLGFLCFKSGDMVGSAAHLEKALTELGSPAPRNIVVQTLAVVRELFVQTLHTWLPSTFTQRRKTDTQAGKRDLFRARVYDLLSYPYWWIKGPVPNLWAHLRHMNLSERYPPSQVMGRSYSFHAILMQAVPMPRRGIAYSERSYEIHHAEGDLQGQGKARSYQTFAYLTAGRFNEGVESGREAVRLLEEAGDVWEANMARIILSVPLYYKGDHESAASEISKAVHIGKETGDVSSVVIALWFWALYAPEQVPEGMIQAELNQPSRDPLSDTSIILARGLELLYREDNPREAAKVLQESLDVARKRGLRNPCVFCGVTWKAEALRIVAEREPEGPSRIAALKQARRAVRMALFVTRWYLTSRPHALRERAILSALEGNESKSRRYFEESLKLARHQDAAYEAAQTELARGKAGLKFAWPDADQQIESANRQIDRIRSFAARSSEADTAGEGDHSTAC